ncbi:MAG TPA: T9SS type A sorting domain-containing protein [Bacteroidota bacterium]|nr:T9SS type A sorting domain-containing protein [Bacteroidota bacterium]
MMKPHKEVDAMNTLISFFRRPTFLVAVVLTVINVGAKSQTVNVTSTLSVSPSKVILSSANGAGSFQIESNTSWKDSISQPWLTVNKDSGSADGTIIFRAQQNKDSSARMATITVTTTGADTQIVVITQLGTNGFVIPPVPSYSSLKRDSLLPDPFTFLDGSRMANTDLWPARREEIAVLAQEFEYGYKPNTPYSATTGSYSHDSLTVTVTDSGKTISFACTITYPSTGSAPYPALITCGVSSLNSTQLLNMGVAVVTFPSDQIAQENDATSRGIGKFYDLYGSNQSAGALMAWAWGMDRLIDAIEKTPAANIDPKRLGVTGCSRWGKGALACGAFDDRLVLTIPEESGSGGAASWRISDYELANGVFNQALTEIVGENCWFRQNFSQFSGASDKLPYDQHSVIGLIAPRACLIIENDYLWLGPQSTWDCANAAQIIWEALSVPDKMGCTESTSHPHCSFPSSEQSAVNAFVGKFLVGNGTANTNIMSSDAGYNFEYGWVDWFSPDNLVTSVRDQGQQSSLPKGFYLEQNYPNPFNPTTTISFGIPKNAFVSLKVYNSLGQEIEELAGKEYPAGRHSVEFNASTLASGAYFCAMKAGDYSVVKKMTILK